MDVRSTMAPLHPGPPKMVRAQQSVSGKVLKPRPHPASNIENSSDDHPVGLWIGVAVVARGRRQPLSAARRHRLGKYQNQEKIQSRTLVTQLSLNPLRHPWNSRVDIRPFEPAHWHFTADSSPMPRRATLITGMIKGMSMKQMCPACKGRRTDGNGRTCQACQGAGEIESKSKQTAIPRPIPEPPKVRPS